MADLPPVTFASTRIEREFAELPRRNAKLYGLFDEVAEHAFEAHGVILCLTCIYRTPAEDRELEGTGIHVVWGAIDVRTRDLPQAAVDEIVDWTNGRWLYNPATPSRPVAYAKPHGDGPHAHFQVRAETRLRAAAPAAPVLKDIA